MKKFFLMLFAAVLLVGCGNGEKKDAKEKSASESVKNEVKDAKPSYNGHEYVDLGLPSGLKWATCNVGATSPEDYGHYFAWGETTPKSSYTEDNCKTWEKNIGDISGNPQYDAARANWGGSWRLPTKEEMQELIDNCTWTWTAQNGTNGYRVTGPSGNSIFLPAAGWRLGTSLYRAGELGDYWTSTPRESHTQSAFHLYFGSDNRDVGWSGRYGGLSVRPVSEYVSCSNGKKNGAKENSASESVKNEVKDTKLFINGHEYVDLGLPSGLKWATCNVGASLPEKYGDYFAWGETTPKSSYTYDNCKTWEKNIGDISGDPQYDAARSNWGGSWRLPTKAEMQELIDNCTWEWTTYNGKYGSLVTSNINGNSIFLPAAGWRDGTSLYDAGELGYYWTSTPFESGTQLVYDLLFDSDVHGVDWRYRDSGRSVRPVSE